MVKRQLRGLAKALRKQTSSFSKVVRIDPVPPQLAAFGAEALERFCSGKASSLDEAFGVKPRRGPKRQVDKHLEMSRFILRQRVAGKRWQDIYPKLSKYGISDERTMRRIYQEHKVQVVSEELARRLKDR